MGDVIDPASDAAAAKRVGFPILGLLLFQRVLEADVARVHAEKDDHRPDAR